MRKGHTPKTGTKAVGRKPGIRKAMKGLDEHDRATTSRGAKGYKKRLEGKAL